MATHECLCDLARGSPYKPEQIVLLLEGVDDVR